MELATAQETAAEIVKPAGTEITAPGAEPKPVVTTPPKQDMTSPRFAALAKKETQLVRERAAIKTEREAIAKEKLEAQKLVEAQRLAISNPLKAMELLGISYKQLTEFVLNDEKPTPELQAKSLREEIKNEWQKELEERDKKAAAQREEQDKAQQQKVLSQFKEQTGEFIRVNKDKYPLINHPKNDFDYSIDTIAAIIEQHYDKTSEKNEDGAIIKAGKLLSVSEATQMYEDHLVDLSKSFYEAKNPPKSEGQATDLKKSNENVHEPRTITNTMQSGMATNLPAKTEQDRLNRALAALSR